MNRRAFLTGLVAVALAPMVPIPAIPPQTIVVDSLTSASDWFLAEASARHNARKALAYALRYGAGPEALKRLRQSATAPHTWGMGGLRTLP